MVAGELADRVVRMFSRRSEDSVQAVGSGYRATLAEATELLRLFTEETGESESFERRVFEVARELEVAGTYRQSFEELQFGARVAWRNSNRCVGRRYWQSLEVLDLRDSTTFEEVRIGLIEHLRRATNQGKIAPTISIFPSAGPGEEGIRIWNEQLIRYAGYRGEDGRVIGDPRQLEITEKILELGWEPESRGQFDVLPVVVEMPGESPRWFELPEDAVLEVPLEHPDFPQLGELGLRWHAVPAISGMRLEMGGLSYPAAPFNGWYMGAEIGARNLADEDRYDLLPSMAEAMGLDASRNRDLWKDRALVELNFAVLWSFEQAQVKIVDHHTVSEHFVRFEDREEREGRCAYADWAWVVPPISGSATPLFHRQYEDVMENPNFYWHESPWKEEPAAGCPFHSS